MKQKLLQGVLDAPADDGVRLVYADYLMEQDDPRGEFIATQVRIAGSLNPASRKAERQREQALWRKHEAEYTAHLAPLRHEFEWVFRRGFVDEIEGDGEAFVGVCDQIFSTEPICRLTLRDVDDSTLQALLDKGIVGRLCNLSLQGQLSSSIKLLAESEQLASLRRINLARCSLNDKSILALAGSPYLTCESLTLNHNPIGDPSARALASCSQLAACTQLFVAFTNVGDAGLKAITESTSLQGLQKLGLAGNTNITDAGAHSLLSPDLFPQMRLLELHSHHGLHSTMLENLKKRWQACIRADFP